MEFRGVVFAPAWAYVFCRPEFSTRAFAAWLILEGRREERIRTRWLRPWLAGELGITRSNVAEVLRRGEGIFWQHRGRFYRLRSAGQVWRAVAGLSAVSGASVLPVPRPVLSGPLALLRTYFSRAALSNGPDVCTSEAWSAALLGRSIRTVRDYRRLGRAAGLLLTQPVYARVGSVKLDLQAPQFPQLPQEFVRGTSIYRRQPDIVLLTRPDGEAIDPCARNKSFRLRGGTRQLVGKRYFKSGRQLREWQDKNRAVAADAVVKLGEGTHDWAVCFPPQYRAASKVTSELNREVIPPSSRKQETLYCGGKQSAPSELAAFTSPPARPIVALPQRGGEPLVALNL